MLDIQRARKMGLAFLNRSRIASAYRDVFESERGRVVLYDIVRRARLLETPMVVGAPDETARQIGRQDLAKEILEILRWDPEKVIALANMRDELIGETEAAA